MRTNRLYALKAFEVVNKLVEVSEERAYAGTTSTSEETNNLNNATRTGYPVRKESLVFADA